MHKLTTAALAAALLGVAYAATAGSGNPDGRMPDASAYVSLGFGGAPQVQAPLAYGFQFGDTSQSSVRQQIESRFGGDREWRAPLLRVDFSRGGWRTAKLDGVPMFKQKLGLQQDGGGGGWFSDWSALDWGLLVVGTAGVGVLAAQALGGKNSPENSTATTTGSTTGGSTTGSTTGSTGGTTGGGLLGGLLGGRTGGLTSIDNSTEQLRDVEYQRYLDGGTGHMGDIGG